MDVLQSLRTTYLQLHYCRYVALSDCMCEGVCMNLYSGWEQTRVVQYPQGTQMRVLHHMYRCHCRDKELQVTKGKMLIALSKYECSQWMVESSLRFQVDIDSIMQNWNMLCKMGGCSGTQGWLSVCVTIEVVWAVRQALLYDRVSWMPENYQH